MSAIIRHLRANALNHAVAAAYGALFALFLISIGV